MQIDRAFVRIAEGQVHYRTCGPGADTNALPLYMIHASPAASNNLAPLMGELGASRRVIAPDTLGFGDSPPPTQDVPNAEDYAESVVRVMDALELETCDVYGSHTGAHIACELAILHPDRVRRLVFDGIGMFSGEDKADFLENYAPEVHLDEFGQHLIWAWNFVRDQVLHFPYFRRTPEFRQPGASMPSPEAIQPIVLDVLKGLTTYHKGYRAAFRHPDRERLPLITQRTFCAASETDPLSAGVADAAALVPDSIQEILPGERTPGDLAEKAVRVIAFLDAE
ncbi:MAG: alpha/beta hydrolase [Rhodospirillaceae bacterium]|jgi:pimeloyl-ACP methyl ester carboxylesterase|nr:alpha/beta hydrolase [Rhodospirillaceae bacterium]